MNQQLLIPSGCQQWIRQPTAIGPANQFAVSSALAIYIHGSDDFRLQRILAQHNQHLNAVCWSPVDSKLLACATSEQASALRIPKLISCHDTSSARSMLRLLIVHLFTVHHAWQRCYNSLFTPTRHQPTAVTHAQACLLARLSLLQVIKVYNVESEGVVYSAHVPLQDPIKKLCW
jgi:hypothetical protein